MYNCLPIYHSVGGVVATGAVLVERRLGGDPREILRAAVLGRHRAVGLHAVPVYRRALPLSAQRAAASARDAASLRLCCGNGLRPDVWEKFQSRFRIPQILEFYAATEGNFSLYNVEGKAGAIGRIPPFLAHRFPVALVRFDVERGEPVRDADGFCIALRAGRGRRGDRPDSGRAARTPAAEFEGYTSTQAVREEDPARRVRAGRRLVPHRRSDAQGRSAASSISSTGSATPSAGRARTSRPRGGRGDHGLSRASSRRTSTASPFPARTAAPAWRPSSSTARLRSGGAARSIWRAACRPMRARCSCASGARSTSPRPSSRRRAIWRARASIPAATADALYFDDPRAAKRSCRSTARSIERIQAQAAL